MLSLWVYQEVGIQGTLFTGPLGPQLERFEQMLAFMKDVLSHTGRTRIETLILAVIYRLPSVDLILQGQTQPECLIPERSDKSIREVTKHKRSIQLEIPSITQN